MPNPRRFHAEFLCRSCAKFNEISRAELGSPKSDQSDQSDQPKLDWLKPGAIKLERTKTGAR